MPVCHACGQDNPGIARFCLACGVALPAPTAAREGRKTVTILFCDISGSTAMSESSDPEAVRDLLRSYYERMREVLERHGGTVEKFIGDAVMAVFGVPTLHEDDALRAVRAAMNMVSELDLLAIPARIGINTGEVMAGSGDSLVTGDAVNIAARLEQLAAPGQVLIGETTRALVRDAVSVEPVESLVAKGKTEPLVAWRLVSVSTGAAGYRRRLDAPLVGRASEQKLLAEAYERAGGERCHLFTVMGAAGVGKSRLVAELVHGPAAAATVLVGQCLPYGDGITYWPVAEMMRSAAGVSNDDDRDTARAGLERLVAADEDCLLLADRVACAIGLGASPADTEEIRWAVRRTFELIAHDRPLVLVFEDVHWAEPTLLDLVEHIAEWSRGAPILVVCTARPDLLDQRPSWAGGLTNATTILLEPLAADESEQLVGGLLEGASLSPRQRARVVAAAEGNPLFIEQMLAMLADDAESQDEEPAVPPTIQALLAARLDRLEGDERRVVESASVEGRVFHRSALAELAPASARPALAAHLQRLVRRELIDPEQSLFVGDQAYRFQHMLIRDAAYSSMPKRARAELHERFAIWLEERAGGRIEEYEEILAHHLEQAYALLHDVAALDPLTEELGTRAAARLASAGRRALDRGDGRTALGLLTRATRLPADDRLAHADLLLAASHAAFETGDLDAASDMAGQARAEAAGNEARVLEAQVWVLDLDLLGGEELRPGDVRDLALAAADRLHALHEPRREAEVLLTVASTYQHEGRWTALTAVLERAMVPAEEAGAQALEQGIVGSLGGAMFWGETPCDVGLARLDELLPRLRGSRLRAARLRLYRSDFLAVLGRFDEAQAEMDGALATIDELGCDVYSKSRAFHTASLAQLRGDLQYADAELARSISLLGSNRAWISTLAGWRANVLIQLGRLGEAQDVVSLAQSTSHGDDPNSEPSWRIARAQLLAREGRLEPALELAGEAVAIADRCDEIRFRADHRMSLAELLEHAGHPEEAREAVEQALELYQRKLAVTGIERAERRLAELAAPRA